MVALRNARTTGTVRTPAHGRTRAPDRATPDPACPTRGWADRNSTARCRFPARSPRGHSTAAGERRSRRRGRSVTRAAPGGTPAGCALRTPDRRRPPGSRPLSRFLPFAATHVRHTRRWLPPSGLRRAAAPGAETAGTTNPRTPRMADNTRRSRPRARRAATQRREAAPSAARSSREESRASRSRDTTARNGRRSARCEKSRTTHSTIRIRNRTASHTTSAGWRPWRDTPGCLRARRQLRRRTGRGAAVRAARAGRGR